MFRVGEAIRFWRRALFGCENERIIECGNTKGKLACGKFFFFLEKLCKNVLQFTKKRSTIVGNKIRIIPYRYLCACLGRGNC